MEYRSLISVTGLTGLFELVSSKQDGAIVKSLTDGKSTFVSSRKHQFSHLEGIEIYTTGENVNLQDVFIAMAESKEPLPNDKDNEAIKAYFKKVFPTMDMERVYVSDMRKMVKWSASLTANKVDLKKAEDTVEEVEEVTTSSKTKASTVTEQKVVEEITPTKEVPKKKATKATTEEKTPAIEESEETNKKPPTKKAATKKAAAKDTTNIESEEAAPKKTARKKKSEE